jgi:hypothetical protein
MDKLRLGFQLDNDTSKHDILATLYRGDKVIGHIRMDWSNWLYRVVFSKWGLPKRRLHQHHFSSCCFIAHILAPKIKNALRTNRRASTRRRPQCNFQNKPILRWMPPSRRLRVTSACLWSGYRANFIQSRNHTASMSPSIQELVILRS